MSLEAFSYITSLNASNPVGATDTKAQGDDHIRGIKSTLLASFPGINAPVSSTPTELNLLHGKTLLSSDDVIDNIPAGTKTTFFQSAAPTGWTQDTANNDCMLRVVSGTGGGTGGTDSPISLSHTHADTFAVDDHTLVVDEIPAHTHTTELKGAGGSNYFDINNTASGAHFAWIPTTSTGGGGAHNHGLSGTVSTYAITPKYLDTIICAKD